MTGDNVYSIIQDRDQIVLRRFSESESSVTSGELVIRSSLYINVPFSLSAVNPTY